MPGVAWDFQGCTAVVTGGTSGIGRAVARALAVAGATTLACGRLADRPESEEPPLPAEAARRLRDVELDVADAGSIESCLSRVERLDLLVNCAGMILRGGREFDPVEFSRVLEVNLTGTMRMCVACRPMLAANRGCIVNTASMLTFFGSGFVPAYSASKGGVGQLTKSLAIAWAEEGIRVNAVAPGWIRTALTEPLARDEARSRSLMDRTPMKRWGTPEDLTGAVLFLASPAAAFITGVVLPVDGGYAIA